MNELQWRLDAAEMQISEVQERTDEKLKDHEQKITDAEEVKKYLYDAVRDLALQGRLLEGIALGVSPKFISSLSCLVLTDIQYHPFVGALAVRKHLDCV